MPRMQRLARRTRQAAMSTAARSTGGFITPAALIRAAILNKALLKAVKHPEVTLRTEDGDELEIVDEQLPEQHDPDRHGESE